MCAHVPELMCVHVPMMCAHVPELMCAHVPMMCAAVEARSPR